MPMVSVLTFGLLAWGAVLPRDLSGTGGMENGEIYKMELNGKIIGKFGTAGKLLNNSGRRMNSIAAARMRSLWVKLQIGECRN